MLGTILKQIPRMIDISAVRTDATLDEIDMVVDAAVSHNFICVFAMPCFTPVLVEKLEEHKEILVGGVVGFPSGADTTRIKKEQTIEMLNAGVDEIDMVINVGALKSNKYELVYDDIKAVVETANGLPVKTILETAYLTDDEITKASKTAVKAGVTYIKTGTGWANKPTTVDTVKIIKRAIGDSAKIKAAGGVRDLDTMLKMIDEGCSRFGIGLYTALEIMKQVRERTE